MGGAAPPANEAKQRNFASELAYKVTVREGEALVIITAGGNDLYSVLRNPSGVEERVEKTVNNWREIAEYFLDDERFPDGSTVLMTNVYEPTDAVGQVDGCFYGLNISFFFGIYQDSLPPLPSTTLNRFRLRSTRRRKRHRWNLSFH